ncbi:MAG TPA: hypothetical protein VHX14_02920 [Thermoanaerobaculia bacterium]|jgi:hypothetical protein|nr:hypothetical protein [Thermoanaerobaculia bacterium]
MRKTLVQLAESPEGGLLSIAGGMWWQIFEAAHNWTYICDLARKAGFGSALAEGLHPSAITMILLGSAWVLLGKAAQRNARPVIVRLARPDVVREIKAMMQGSDNGFVHYHQDKDSTDFTILKWVSRR